MKNTISLDTICASLCYAMGVEKPAQAARENKILCDFADKAFSKEKCDRIFMYNPDAVAQWLSEKYAHLLSDVLELCPLELPLVSVMPSVTPVCFGTMYTGAQPEIHGIQAYVKPVIKIDTVFDAMIRAGKKPVIVATAGDSMSKIYLERDMDYFFYPTVDEVNAKAVELIKEDKYDLYCIYNGNYDAAMHRHGTEAEESLRQLKRNNDDFKMFHELISEQWKNHRTLMGFAMDHGCHEIDGGCGSHGLDMDEDLNIVHRYTIIK